MEYVIERVYTMSDIWVGEADSLEEAVQKACMEGNWEIDGTVYVKGRYNVNDEDEFHDIPEELSNKLKKTV